jgi:cell division septation protein DedD
VDPDLAEADYQRLIVEFPGGPYSDRALLRLGYAAHARDDLATARGSFETLVRDYPGSPLRSVAQRWLEEYGDSVPAGPPRDEARAQVLAGVPADTAGEPATDIAAEAVTDTRAEVVTDTAAGVVADRAAEVTPDTAVVVPPTVRPAPAPPEETTRAAPETAGRYTVQLGAFSMMAGARSILRRARSAGLDARLVRTEGSELIRVRVGRYSDAAAASRARAEVRSMGLEAIVVEDADRESPVT